MKQIIASVCLAMAISMNIFAQTELRVASYNLRMDTSRDGENAWSHRQEMVKGFIRFNQIDIVGTQEGFKHQLDDILEVGVQLRGLGAGRWERGGRTLGHPL